MSLRMEALYLDLSYLLPHDTILYLKLNKSKFSLSDYLHFSAQRSHAPSDYGIREPIGYFHHHKILHWTVLIYTPVRNALYMKK